MAEQNCILVDWFSAVCFLEDYNELFPILGLVSAECDRFKDGTGRYGFRKCIYLVDTSDKSRGIFIYYDYYEDSELEGSGLPRRVWLEMSGMGCRAFESLSEGVTFLDLLKKCVVDRPDDEPFFKINRLDIAYDIYNDPLLFDRVKAARADGCIISALSSSQLVEDVELVGGKFPDYIGRTLYLGSAQSEIRFRLYDKKLERHRDDIESWYRWEVQLRREQALRFCEALFTLSKGETPNIGECYKALLDNYVRIVKRDPNDSNYRRWASPVWWQRFVNHTLKFEHLSKKGIEYNLLSAVYLVEHQYGNTIDTILKTLGEAALIELVKNRSQELNFKQLNAIRLYQMEQGSDSNE